MSVELGDYVESLQRAVTPLGGTVAAVSDNVWIGYLTDAFWEARLDGFMVGYVADEDGLVTPSAIDGPDLDRSWVSLVIMYAAIKVLQNQILNTQSSFRAKAGPVEFETQNSANTMTEMLKQLAASKTRLLEDLRETGQTNVHLIDAFSVRALSYASYYGSSQLIGD